MKLLQAFQQLILIVFFFSIESFQSNTYDSISSIYSSTYSAKINSNNTNSLFVAVRVAASNGRLFIACQQDGLLVIDQGNIIYQNTVGPSVNEDLAVTDDGEFVFISEQGTLHIYQFSQSQLNQTKYNLQRIFSGTTEFDSVVEITFFDNQNKVIAVGGSGKIALFDISKRKQRIIQYLGENLLSSQLKNVRISNECNYLIFTDWTYGVMVFSWDDNTISCSNKVSLQNMQLIAVCDSVSPTTVALTKDNRYFLMLEYWDGFSIIDLEEAYQQQPGAATVFNIQPIVSHWWPNSKSFPSGRAFALTDNEQYAVMGERSVGLYVVDVSVKSSPHFFQLIQSKYFTLTATFSADESVLYYSNGYSVMNFPKISANLNIDVPNLFNIHQSILYNIGTTKWKWTAKVDKNSKYLFCTDYDNGLLIADIKSLPLAVKQLAFISSEGGSIDNFLNFGDNSQYLAVPVQTPQTILNIYSFTQDTQLNLIYSVPSSHSSYVYSMDINESETLIVCDNELSLVFIQQSTPGVFTAVSRWNFPDGLFSGYLNGAIFDTSSKYVIILQRNNLIASVDISNLQSPIIKDKYLTFGGEFISRGKYNHKNYAFLADGLAGVKVIDLLKLPKIVIVYEISNIRGYSNHIQLLKNDQFALVSQLDSGYITLIQTSDLSNLSVVSTLQKENEHVISTTTTPSGDYFFVINSQGIRVIPLISQVLIHTDLQLQMQSDTGVITYSPKDPSESLLVGEIIVMTFLILRPDPGITILNIQYLENEKTKELPFWMKFDSIDKTLTVSTAKEALEVGTYSQINTIIIQTTTPLVATSFKDMADSSSDPNIIQISATQSQEIFQYLQSIYVIDSKGFVLSTFDFEQSLDLTSVVLPTQQSVYNEFQAQILYSLQKSIMYNPIRFTVKASLEFNAMSSNSNFVTTVSSQVSLYFTIPSEIGKFVLKSFAGVIASLSQSQNQLKIEGDPDNINKALSSEVLVFLYDQININSTAISIRLDDGTNYQIIYSVKIPETTFMRLIQVVQIQQDMTLQTQVNKLFSNGSADINTLILIEFAENTFQIDHLMSSSQLTYSAEMIDSNMQTYAIPISLWIQFSPQLRKFSGTSSFSQYGKSFCFKISATDTYTSASDQFCIKIDGIPFIVIFNIFIQIAGPIIFVLGFYRYRHIFYNSFLAKKNFYPTEIAILGKPFQQKTIFLGQTVLFADAILRYFIQELNSFRLSPTPSSEKKQDVSQKSSGDLLLDLILPKLKSLQFKGIILSAPALSSSSSSTPLTKEWLQNIKEVHSINQFQSISGIQQSYVQDNNFLFEKFLEDLFNINFGFKFNGCYTKIQDLKQDLNKPSNILRLSLRGVLARYLLNQDKLTMKVYSLMKETAINNTKIKVFHRDQMQQQHKFDMPTQNLNSNKWYIQYVKINELGEDYIDENTVQQSLISKPIGSDMQAIKKDFQLPKITINENAIENFIKDHIQIPNWLLAKLLTDCNLNSDNHSREIIPLRINKELLKEVLLADAFGIYFPKSSLIFPSCGESLHLFQNQISSVQAFIKSDRKTHFASIYRLLDLEYVHIASYQNRQLPHWLDYAFKQDMLLLSGTPQIEDARRILIRFYDQNQCIVKQFFLELQGNIPKTRSQENIELLLFSQNQQQLAYSMNEKYPSITTRGNAVSLMPSRFAAISDMLLNNDNEMNLVKEQSMKQLETDKKTTDMNYYSRNNNENDIILDLQDNGSIVEIPFYQLDQPQSCDRPRVFDNKTIGFLNSPISSRHLNFENKSKEQQ